MFCPDALSCGRSPARGEGERVLALESREGTRASRRVDPGGARNATPRSLPSLEAQMVKNPPAMQETQIQSLGQEDPLKRGMVLLLSRFSHVQLFASLWTVACQAPLYMGISRQ